METRMTQLFGIKYPLMLSGMNYVTTPTLVAAVSNAGGLGILAGAAYTKDQLRNAIREIRSLTEKPFGVNVTLYLPGAKDVVEVILEEKPPVINYALGKATEIIKATHGWGGKVIGSVATTKHALRAVNDGVDALAVTGHEAAAHGGEVASMVIIPAIASKAKVPVIAAGGFYNGRGLIAALALGAAGISLGTRFAMTKESPVHDYYKKLMASASEEDTMITDRWDGLPGRLFKTESALDLVKKRGLGMDTLTSTLRMKRELNLSWGELIAGSLRMKKVEQLSLGKMVAIPVGFSMLKRAIFDGDKDGIMLAGQNVGLINDVLTCQEVIDQIMAEALKVKEEISKL